MINTEYINRDKINAIKKLWCLFCDGWNTVYRAVLGLKSLESVKKYRSCAVDWI